MDGGSARGMTVSVFFTRLGLLFVEGRLTEMTAFWSFPCPVEVNGSLVVMHGAKDLEAFFASRRVGAIEAGMTSFEPRITAIEMPRAGRFRVWLRWAVTFGDVCVIDDRFSVYYMAREPWGGLTIEMMDIVVIPPELALASTD